MGKKAGFYSVKFDGEDKSEAEKFFERFVDVYPDKIDNLYTQIVVQADVRGCMDFLVHLERGSIWKFKEDKLRLYCIRFNNSVVILGDGDFKTVRAAQDSKYLTSCVENLEKVESAINKRIIYDKELKVSGNRLSGDFKFELD